MTGVISAADCLFYYTHFAMAEESLATAASVASAALQIGCNALTAALEDPHFTVNTSAELAAGVMGVLVNEDFAKTMSGEISFPNVHKYIQ